MICGIAHLPNIPLDKDPSWWISYLINIVKYPIRQTSLLKVLRKTNLWPKYISPDKYLTWWIYLLINVSCDKYLTRQRSQPISLLISTGISYWMFDRTKFFSDKYLPCQIRYIAWKFITSQAVPHMTNVVTLQICQVPIPPFCKCLTWWESWLTNTVYRVLTSA